MRRRADLAECREEFLVPTLLIWHDLFDRRAETVYQGIHRLDDEEENGTGDSDEREQVGEEGTVTEDRVVDRESQLTKVRLPDDHRNDGHQEVVDERND